MGGYSGYDPLPAFPNYGDVTIPKPYRVYKVDLNTVKLTVNKTPDERFAGRIVVIKI